MKLPTSTPLGGCLIFALTVSAIPIFASMSLTTAPLGPATKDFLARLLGLATICLLGWVAATALRVASDLYLRRFRLDVEDNLLARKHVTQVRVLVRVLDAVIALVTSASR